MGDNYMPEPFEVKLFIKGAAYSDKSAALASAIEVMSGYEESLSHCLTIAAKKYSTDDLYFPIPKIGLVSTKTGSLDVNTIIDCATITLPLAPELPNMISYGIELYKHASKLIDIATNFFNKTGKPLTVHIENSPGTLTVVNVGNGTVNISDGNILGAGLLIHKGINKMASQIEAGSVDSVEVTSSNIADSNQYTALLLNQSNKAAFKLIPKKVVEDKVITIKCGIYSYNKKSGKGSLDIIEEDSYRNCKFEVRDVDSELIAGAMLAIYSVVSATTEMTVNALGETLIGKLYIHSIKNFFDDRDDVDLI
jgi:hypothetical protein